MANLMITPSKLSGEVKIPPSKSMAHRAIICAALSDGLSFNKEDFLDNINEYEDIIAIIEELQENLKYDEIECVGENECCNKTKKNYIVEIQGFINQNDEFITMEEAKENNQLNSGVMDLFVIRLYKCVDCGKWIIDILE